MKSTLAGIILAGGQSSRMGRNKALLPLPGTSSSTFMAQQVTLLCALCREVVLVARDQEQAELYHHSHLSPQIRIVIDDASDVGPLMGVYSGLQAIHSTHALITAVDMPFLRPELLQFLAEQIIEDEIVMPVVSDVPQVLLAIYPRSTLPLIEMLLLTGERGPRALLEKTAVHYIDEAQLRLVDPRLYSFMNINTPAELAAVSDQRDSFPL